MKSRLELPPFDYVGQALTAVGSDCIIEFFAPSQASSNLVLRSAPGGRLRLRLRLREDVRGWRLEGGGERERERLRGEREDGAAVLRLSGEEAGFHSSQPAARPRSCTMIFSLHGGCGTGVS